MAHASPRRVEDELQGPDGGSTPIPVTPPFEDPAALRRRVEILRACVSKIVVHDEDDTDDIKVEIFGPLVPPNRATRHVPAAPSPSGAAAVAGCLVATAALYGTAMLL